nr:PTS sugar transporter subunit IIA [Microvirga massiliensis]
MDIRDFLDPGDVAVGLRLPDKRRVLEEIARRAAAVLGLDQASILETLLAREALGSTGIGEGTAIPHARLAGIGKPFGLLVRLKQPVGFDAIDAQPVDLVFLLLLPAAAHGEQLTALARVARRFRDPGVLNRLRRARDAQALYCALTGPE